MTKEGLVPTKALSRAAIAKLLEDRRKSYPARMEAHARSVFLQREIRQKNAAAPERIIRAAPYRQHEPNGNARRGADKGEAGAADRISRAASLMPKGKLKVK